MMYTAVNIVHTNNQRKMQKREREREPLPRRHVSVVSADNPPTNARSQKFMSIGLDSLCAKE